MKQKKQIKDKNFIKVVPNEHIKEKNNRIKGSKKNMDNKILGDKGEKVAVKYLQSKGFSVVTTNYYRNVGEIDIIAYKNNVIHFVEVKSVSRETYNDVYHETNSIYRPEIRVNYEKMFHMKQTINLFIAENNLFNHLIQIDIVTVSFYRNRSEPTINYIENIQLT